MSFLNSMRAADSPSIDAFGRWRTSEAFTVFDSKQLVDAAPLFWDDQEVSGGGTTSTHSVDKASSTMGVALNTAGKRTRQTFRRLNYQPGKSHQVFMTGVLDVSGGGAGITRAWGLYDDDNGVFLIDDEGTLKVVIRSKATGSVVDDAIAQDDWNLDKLDGTGRSKKTLDITKMQIMTLDFEWLGAGRVRIGFIIDGMTIYVHEFLNANVLANVYMSTPNLPLRYEIENDGTGAASTMDHNCATVVSEGGRDPNGVVRYKSTEGTHVDANDENTIYAIVGIRLKSTHLGAQITPIAASLAEHQGSKELEWLLIFNPTIAGSPTWAAETNSAIETFTGETANELTGGTITDGGHFSSARQGGSTEAAELESALRLGANIAGTVDEIVLAVRPIAGSPANADVEGALTWREII